MAMPSDWPAFGVTQRSDIAADHFVPVDKKLRPEWVKLLTARGERKIFRGPELKTIGMPCGGITAGQMYLLGDGTLGYWWIANNAYNTGYGKNYQIDTPLGVYPTMYQTQPFSPPSPVDEGFALRADGRVWQLNADDFDAIEFIGEYPIATIRYLCADKPAPPVQVEATVFSPFIPLQTRDSATPATVLRYTVTNTSGKPMRVDVAGWLQNPVMMTHRDRWHALCRNRVVSAGSLRAVHMEVVADHSRPEHPRRAEVFEDFEKGYDNWTVEGEAFGKAPAKGTQPHQQPVAGFVGEGLVNTFQGSDKLTGRLTSKPFKISEPFISFLIGGGNERDKTCVNLLVDGQTVRNATGANNETLTWTNWDVSDLAGREARIEIVDEASGPWGHINVDRIEFANQPMVEDTQFDPAHPYMGQVAWSVLSPDGWAAPQFPSRAAFLQAFADHGSNAGGNEVTATFALGRPQVAAVGNGAMLAAGESRTFDFALSWYFPNRHLNSVSWGKPVLMGKRVGNRYTTWYSDAVDVAVQLSERFEALTDATQRFRDALYDTTLPYWLVQRLSMPLANLATETCHWQEDGFFYGWEGVCCCSGNCGHVWNYAQGMAWMFPELERRVREMQDWNPQMGFDESTGAIFFRGSKRGLWAGDSQPGYVLKAYREHLLTSDNAFLERNWPAIRKSLQFLIDLDEDGDGLISKTQHNTYDINFIGVTPLTTTLYLAALRAGERMAALMNDHDFARTVAAIHQRGSELAVKQMFNGEYLIQGREAVEKQTNQTGDGCLTDQVFGQTWADLLNLGDLYDDKVVRSCLESIWKYNWTPDVAPQNKAHAPERIYAFPGEAGLFICTWPHSEHPGDRAVRYRDEVWTGGDYQVATAMIQRGMMTEALAIIRGVHERYDAHKHNPWNEVECGDHYARALASWGCLLTLSGYHHDGPARLLAFNPRLNPEDFRCFYSTADGWGTFAQQREGKQQTNHLLPRHGQLALATLQLHTDEKHTPRSSKATLDGRDVPHTMTRDGRRVTLLFDPELVIAPDQDLSVTLS